MSKTAVIIHGTMGSPQGNWFSWLKTKLEKDGYNVVVPTMPTPENQMVESWNATIKAQTLAFNEKTILIGHSIGATHALHVLEKLETSIAHTIFVSIVMEDIGITEYDNLNYSFIHHDFDWDKIRRNSSKFTIFHSDNDPYVPVSHAQTLSKNLYTPVTLIKNGGHLNSESGFNSFDKLYTCL